MKYQDKMPYENTINSGLTRKSIISKTMQVGGFTLLSRFLGIIRELLQVRYFGASALSDAFFTAYKIPNSLRKIFAEGALSAAFVPSIVQTVKHEGRKGIGGLMSLGFLFFESIVLILCAYAMYYSEWLLSYIVPGFTAQEIATTALFLDILMPFIFFISSSALLAGPLQAIGHFFVPAFSPVLLNIIYIMGIALCLFLNLPIPYLCWIILIGGFIQLLMHIFAYFKFGFNFASIKRADVWLFIKIFPKFFFCLLSMSVLEVGLFIDTSFASLLPKKGSISLIYYANRFMGIPLGVFAVAFATILLPHFSRVSIYAPKRLGFYVLEATKLVWWVLLPITIVMGLLSHKIFTTIFLSEKFTLAQANEAATILAIFLCALFSFAINKILSNVYYSLHNTWIPGIIAVLSVGLNAYLDWVFIDSFGAAGLAAATSIATIVQTICLFVLLQYYFGLALYCGHFIRFVYQSVIQVVVVGIPFIGVYFMGLYAGTLLSHTVSSFFMNSVGFWLWVGPLCALYMLALYTTRLQFKVRLLFLEG